MEILDDEIREPKQFWEDFYEDRTIHIPFFKVKEPDEYLVEWISPKKVLELGAGPGKKSIYMVKQGSK
ncbi:hypothetical protein M3197_12430 [Sporosarcina aquimarina]|uniref:hypothetical protein n=1 Tax=Sporosarcina aquimarina TaxID=114975 RepID=UPI00203D0FF9|nr:hypothetical protein [Sporosarcina aquimarina]MCM3758269.1 hypothetical protein [Sporosarcina aquimarina]